MAISTYGFQGTVNESGSARRFSQAMVLAKVVGPGHLHVTPVPSRIRGLDVSPGTAIVAGVLVDVPAVTTLSIEPNPTRYPRYDVVALRLTWGNGRGGSSSEIRVLRSSEDMLAPLENRPGEVVDFPLAIVEVDTNATTFTTAHISNVAPWGAGGELSTVGSPPGHMKVAPGTRVVSSNGDVWQQKGDGPQNGYRPLKRPSAEWQNFSPQIASDAGRVNLGNGGVERGRYKMINNMLYGEFEVRSGTDGFNWGHGPLRIKLPLPREGANTPQDNWCSAHAFTIAGGEPMDWKVQMILAQKNRDAFLFAPRAANDCRISHMSASDSSARIPGTGTPKIVGAVSDFAVVSGSFRYTVGF